MICVIRKITWPSPLQLLKELVNSHPVCNYRNFSQVFRRHQRKLAKMLLQEPKFQMSIEDKPEKILAEMIASHAKLTARMRPNTNTNETLLQWCVFEII